MPFIAFSYLIALARISNIILIRSGGSGNPWFISNFKGKVVNILQLRMMLVVGFFVDALYQIEEVQGREFYLFTDLYQMCSIMLSESNFSVNTC